MPSFPLAFISPGGGELIMIMLVLILLFGAKDAPRILRTIQTFLDKMQRNAAAFRYKIMYGDLHQNADEETPYDVDADYTENDDPLFHEGEEPETDAEEEEEEKNHDSEFDAQRSGRNSESAPPELGTENPELNP